MRDGAGTGSDRGEIEDADAVERGWPSGEFAWHQKFFGSPRPRRAMMFFWISEEPPPIVSITV